MKTIERLMKVYIAEDGTEFLRQYQCESYEEDLLKSKQRCEFLGEAETCEKYHMKRHEYWYPAVIENINDYSVSIQHTYPITGELWCCSESTAKSLDRLEGYPDLFYRKEIPIMQDAKVINAWMYFFNYHLKDELKEIILEWKED